MDNSEFLKLLFEKIDNLDDKQDQMKHDLCAKVDEKHEEVRARLDKYNQELEKHIARNDNFEKDLNTFREIAKPIIEDFNQKKAFNETIKDFILRWTKRIGFIGAITGATYGIIKLVMFFNGVP
jgi:uncharacterized coiled-coil DUF342 family protein